MHKRNAEYAGRATEVFSAWVHEDASDLEAFLGVHHRAFGDGMLVIDFVMDRENLLWYCESGLKLYDAACQRALPVPPPPDAPCKRKVEAVVQHIASRILNI